MEDKLGITTTEFDRGERAGLFSMNRPWNDDERAWMMTFMTRVYEQFKERIRESRGERIKGNLEDMAEGRVYTGRQALERGLVDRIGGLSDAIEYTAKKVGLDDYDVHVLPEPKNPLEMIFAALTGEEPDDEWEISTSPAAATSDPLLRAILPLLDGVAPQQLRNIGRGLQNIMILNQEHLGCVMPFDLTIR